MRVSREHYGPGDPLRRLTGAGADREQLTGVWGILATVGLAAQMEHHFKQVRSGRDWKRQARLKRADNARLSRLPSRTRSFGRDLATVMSNPEFDPRSLLSHAKTMSLAERVSRNDSGMRKTVLEWLTLPRLLDGFAMYLEECVAIRKDSRTRPHRSDWLFRRQVVALLDYVRQATGDPHYSEVADLVNEELRRVRSSRNCVTKTHSSMHSCFPPF